MILLTNIIDLVKKYFNIKFYIVNDLKFSKKELEGFNFYQIRLFVFVIRDVLNYQIIKPSDDDTLSAWVIIFDHYANSNISINFYNRIKLYLSNPKQFISDEDMKYYKDWILTLNPIFSKEKSISLDFDKSFNVLEVKNQIEDLKAKKVVYL